MPEKNSLGSLSGSYRTRLAELARERRNRTLKATVLFLDDTTQIFEIDKRSKGSKLLHAVFQHLELQESDYFGLEFQHQQDGVV